MVTDSARLDENLDLGEILELTAADVAGYCDSALEATTLAREIDDEDGPWTRKFLCRHLGIGESTLSGWLKEGRVPRMAKAAIVFLPVMDLLKNEIERLRNHARNLKILKSGDIYQLCVFHEDEDGLVVGRVVADGIPTLDLARQVSVLFDAENLLQRAKGVVSDMLHRLEQHSNERYIDSLFKLQKEITEHYAFSFDYEYFKKHYGKNRVSGVKLDEATLAKIVSAAKSDEPTGDDNGNPTGGGTQ